MRRVARQTRGREAEAVMEEVTAERRDVCEYERWVW